MIDTIEANWLVFAAALLVALLIAWWLFSRAARTPERERRPDVLDEGAAPAQRNQALIDAPPAAQIITPSPVSGTMAGVGEAVAVAAQDAVEEARVIAAPPPPPPPPLPEEIPTPSPDPAPELPDESPQESPPPPQNPPETEPQPAPDLPDERPVEAPPPQQAPAAPAATIDDLARIKGLGPKLQTLLPTLGITSFAQIAALSEADLAELDPKLGPFAGRPARDNWVEQAKYLAVGDVAGFEAQFGKV